MVWFRGSLIIVLVLIAVSLLLVGLTAAMTNMPCRSSVDPFAKGKAEAFANGRGIDPFAKGKAEAFVPVIPDTRVQTPPSTLGGDPVELNGCWRKLLTYLQANPGKAMPFINFVKANFFDTSCGIRQPRIHFETLADQYQPIFT